jgi:predicted small secreted protein
MKKLITALLVLTSLNLRAQESCPNPYNVQIVHKAGNAANPNGWWVLRIPYTSPTSGNHSIKWEVKGVCYYTGCFETVQGFGQWESDSLICSQKPYYVITPMTGRFCNGTVCTNILLSNSNSISWDGNKIHFQGTLYLKGQVLPVATISPYIPTISGEYYNNDGKSVYVNKLNRQTRFVVYDLMGREVKQVIYQPNALLPKRISLVGNQYFIFKQIQ